MWGRGLCDCVYMCVYLCVIDCLCICVYVCDCTCMCDSSLEIGPPNDTPTPAHKEVTMVSGMASKAYRLFATDKNWKVLYHTGRWKCAILICFSKLFFIYTSQTCIFGPDFFWIHVERNSLLLGTLVIEILASLVTLWCYVNANIYRYKHLLFTWF